jgi:hypothetical protein
LFSILLDIHRNINFINKKQQAAKRVIDQDIPNIKRREDNIIILASIL